MIKKLIAAVLILTIVFVLGILPLISRSLSGIKPIFQKSNQLPAFTPPEESTPTEPKLSLNIYADSLQKPRDLLFTPGGTLLVSVPTLSKIEALWGTNKEGKAENTKDVVIGLNKPHGLAWANNKLFVAEETAVKRYAWDESKKTATFEKKLFDLPSGGRHVTRSLAITPDNQLFVSLGSTCDVCVEKQPWLAAVVISNTEGENPHIYASGLRNSVFIALDPDTNKLWGTDMGRDMIGDNIPPDEINIIEEGLNYGWPYCYGQQIFDTENKLGGSASMCAHTQSPLYQIQAHSAPLGLVFVPDVKPWQSWAGDLLVAYHGSWNRSQPVGYKVVRLKREGDQIIKEETLFDFLEGDTSQGRPVDLVFSPDGKLFISDDSKGVIYQVTSQFSSTQN
jgi:glucose/arabinose dehydrogenase